EPEGGAHLDHDATARLLDEALTRALAELSQASEADLIANRYEKFRRMGECFTPGIPAS
ncbi:MAG: acetyl-CoA carboxylase carboxyl transferase subunit alpha, partial [Candidatus Acidiferrales bacterium]